MKGGKEKGWRKRNEEKVGKRERNEECRESGTGWQAEMRSYKDWRRGCKRDKWKSWKKRNQKRRTQREEKDTSRMVKKSGNYWKRKKTEDKGER